MAALATTQELADFLGEEIPTAQATQALDIASEVVRDYCGWQISRVTETVRADGVAGLALLLPTLQINEVTEVRIGDAEITDYSWSDSGILYRAGGWPALVRGISVTLDHGYSPPPGAVRLAVLQAAARGVVNPAGMRSIQASGISEVHANAEVMVPTGPERRVLDRYRVA